MKPNKILLFVFLGFVFWLATALVVRYLGARVFSMGNPYLVLVFVLAIPLTLVFMWLTARLSRVGMHELLEPSVVITFTFTLLDGVALAWFRPLYSESSEGALLCGAWILWSAGLALLIPFVYQRLKPVA